MAAVAIDYGIDAPLIPRAWFGRAGWSVAVGLAFWFMNRQEYPGPAGRVLAVLALLGVEFSARSRGLHSAPSSSASPSNSARSTSRPTRSS